MIVRKSKLRHDQTEIDDADMHHYVDSVMKFYSGPVEVAKDLKRF